MNQPTETTVNKSPFVLAGMGRQYPADYLEDLREVVLDGLTAYLKKSSDPHAADLSRAIDRLVTVSVSAERLSQTGSLDDVQADLTASTVPDLIEIMARLGYSW